MMTFGDNSLPTHHVENNFIYGVEFIWVKAAMPFSGYLWTDVQHALVLLLYL
jgi:hypothetical protein